VLLISQFCIAELPGHTAGYRIQRGLKRCRKVVDISFSSRVVVERRSQHPPVVLVDDLIVSSCSTSWASRQPLQRSYIRANESTRRGTPTYLRFYYEGIRPDVRPSNLLRVEQYRFFDVGSRRIATMPDQLMIVGHLPHATRPGKRRVGSISSSQRRDRSSHCRYHPGSSRAARPVVGKARMPWFWDVLVRARGPFRPLPY